jgi:hypothetical protein
MTPPDGESGTLLGSFEFFDYVLSLCDFVGQNLAHKFSYAKRYSTLAFRYELVRRAY